MLSVKLLTWQGLCYTGKSINNFNVRVFLCYWVDRLLFSMRYMELSHHVLGNGEWFLEELQLFKEVTVLPWSLFFFVGVALASNFLSCFREPLCCFLSPTVLCWLLTTEAASCLTFLGLCFSAVCGHGRGDHGAIVAVFNMTTVLPSLFSSIGKGEMWANIFVNLVFTEFSFPKIESVLSSLNAGKGSIYSSLYLFSDT